VTEHWVVVVEAVAEAHAPAIETDAMAGLLEELSDCHPGVLCVPNRYAIQLRLRATGAIDALFAAMTRWRQALQAVHAPEWGVVRVEILTGEELERECRSAEMEDQLGDWFASQPRGDAVADDLLRQAFQDPATGLPTVQLFRGYVEQALTRRRPEGAAHAVLVVDVAATAPSPEPPPELVLVEAARRLAATTRSGDTVARVGEDQLALLAPDVAENHAPGLATRALDAVCGPFSTEGRELALRACVGVALSRPGCDADRLLCDATAAMWAAKSAGERRYEMFRPGMATPDPATVGPPSEPRSAEAPDDC
jgi:GGDEF domain-containing protein